jgi:phosphatidylglycerophosphate synthase
VIGSYLDPLADKVLICSVVAALGWSVSGARRFAAGFGGRPWHLLLSFHTIPE